MRYEALKSENSESISIEWSDNGVFISPGYDVRREGYTKNYRECDVFNKYDDFESWMRKWWEDNREIKDEQD